MTEKTTPKEEQELQSLRQIKRSRLIAAALIALAALFVIWNLYDTEFHYTNTEEGRLSALQDYIPGTDSQTGKVGPDDPLQVIAWQTANNRLFIFYAAKQGQCTRDPAPSKGDKRQIQACERKHNAFSFYLRCVQ